MAKTELFAMRVGKDFFEQIDALRGKKTRSAMTRLIIAEAAAPILERGRKAAEQQAMLDAQRAMATARRQTEVDKIINTPSEMEKEAAKREREEAAAIKRRKAGPGADKEAAKRVADKYIPRH